MRGDYADIIGLGRWGIDLVVRIMARIFFASLALFVLLGPTGSASAADEARQSSERFLQGVFWQIHKDGEKIGHIFGTFHSNDERVVKLAPVVEGALLTSSSFSMEAFPGARYFNPHWGFKNVINDMTLPEGETLLGLVGEKTYVRIEALLSQQGVQPERILRLKPWAAMNELSRHSFQGEKKYGDIMDHVLYEIAVSHVSDLYQVETLEELMAAYYAFPVDAQIGLLRDRLEAYGELAQTFEKMTQAYLREDLRQMLELSVGFISGESIAKGFDKVYLKHVLHIRNIVMAHYMLAPLRRKNAFIAVGALHLYGDKGVLQLLEDYGYTVSRVSLGAQPH